MRVLYVEDDRVNAIVFLESVRNDARLECQVAEDGTRALELARAWHPQLLVLDAHLGDTDGFKLLEKIRCEVPALANTPAVMCSADTWPEDRQRARDAGFVDYWAKPLEIDETLRKLGQYAEQLSGS